MLSKKEVRRRLLEFFTVASVDEWLMQFDDLYHWREEDYFQEFISYINSKG